ncbi:Acyl-CoA thioesterase I precursor [Blastochloris viridis]|nr:Acyl-CoA thioesterase I precursor [Blastochloris viridis]CUU43759.1 Acyl-CoA thioesterase I precursor [Blastochloris viridis]
MTAEYGEFPRRDQNRGDSGRRGLLAGAAGVLMTISLAGSMSHVADAANEGGALRLVALGDSLTAGYGLPADAALPVQLQRRLEARGHKVVIVNAGVSGDTASGGLERLDWSIAADAEGAIVALGANDALRGIDPAVTRKALDAILSRLRAKGLEVLLAGMLAPRNLGEAYARAFDAIYPDLARQHGVEFYPFLLEGVVGVPRFNLNDGIHPTAEGVGLIADRMLPAVERLLAKVEAKRAGH